MIHKNNMKNVEKKENKRLILGITIIISAFLLVMNNYTSYFGKVLNKIFPCVEIPTNSAPCFITYDIFFELFLVLVIIVCLVILLVKINKKRKRDE